MMHRINRKDFFIMIFLFVFTAILSGMFLSRNYNGLMSIGDGYDNLDYAQIARNISLGKGFSTDIIRPPYLKYSSRLPAPELYRGPGFPYVLSFFFYFIGVNDITPAISTIFFFCLTIPLIYLLTKRIVNQRVALFVSILIPLNWEMHCYMVSGMSEPLFMFLLILAVYLAHTAPQTTRMALLGVVLGLMCLARPYGFIYIPSIIILVYLQEGEIVRSSEFGVRSGRDEGRRLKNIIVLSLALIITTLPLFIQNMFVFGSPLSPTRSLALIGFTKSYPGWSFHSTINPPLVSEFLSSHFDEFMGKYLYNLKEGLRTFFRSTSIPYIILFIIGSFVDWKEVVQRRFALITLSFVVLTLFILSAGSIFVTRFYAPFIPLIIILAGILISMVVDMVCKDDRFFGNILMGSIIISLFLVFLLRLGDKVEDRAMYDNIGDFIKTHTGVGTVVVTEVPEVVSWYGQRASIYLPQDLTEFEEIDRSYIPVDAILLTDRYHQGMDTEREWKMSLGEPDRFPGFYLDDMFNNGMIRSYLYKKKKGNNLPRINTD